MNPEVISEPCQETPAPGAASTARRWCGWLAMTLPLGFGIAALGADPSWSDDIAIVRDVGLVAVGSEGAISTLLTQLFGLLPVGGHALRAGLVGVLALACASRLLYEAIVSLLDRDGRGWLGALLAAFGSCIWALGPDALASALHPGGPLLALALALLAQRLAKEAFELGELWALAYKEVEGWSAAGGTGEGPPGSPGSVPAVYDTNESVQDADVVLWYIAHVPSTELPRACGPWFALNGYPEPEPDEEDDDHHH